MCWTSCRPLRSGDRSSGPATRSVTGSRNLGLHMLGRHSSKHLAILTLLGLVQLGIYLAMLSLDDLDLKIGNFVALFLLCFSFYVLSIVLVSRSPSGSSVPISGLFVAIILFSMAFRIIMIPLKPGLSHDIMRFLWDGRLLANGVNPYLYRPNASELEAFKNVPYFLDYEFKYTFTVYPPVAQLLFGGAHLLTGDDPFGIKLAVTIFDVINILLLVILMREIKGSISLSGLVMYAWAPLLVVESAGNAHIEPLMTFLLLLSLHWLHKSRFRLSSLSLSLACWSKLYPILLLPVYLKYLRDSKGRGLREFALVFVLSSSLMLAPVFISSGSNLLYQIFWYSQNIAYNSSVFMVVDGVLASLGVGNVVAEVLVYAAFLVSITAILRLKRVRSLPDVADTSILVFGAFLLFAPAVFQWYVLWLLPFLAIRGLNRDGIPWLYLSGAIVLAYLPQFSLNYDAITISLLEYAPFYLLLVFFFLMKTKPFSRIFRNEVS